MNKQTAIEPAMNVHRKLSTARQRFHSLKLEKTGENKFAGYKYFELGDFLIPVLKVFDEVGLGATVSFEPDMAYMRITDLDNPADTIVITSPMGSAALKGCHEVQNIGAVETYQRRYLWVAALEIVEHDALDATNGKIAPEKATETGLIDDGQVTVLQGLANGGVINAKRFCDFFEIEKLTELPAARYDEALRMAQAKQAKKLEPAQ